jgi:uncharacterized membrane protein YidH (DUF202 family)
MHMGLAEALVKILGILLIVFGVIALAVGGINYTTREKVIDVGPIQATAEKHNSIPLPPLVGVVSVVAGIALVAVGARRRV